LARQCLRRKKGASVLAGTCEKGGRSITSRKWNSFKKKSAVTEPEFRTDQLRRKKMSSFAICRGGGKRFKKANGETKRIKKESWGQKGGKETGGDSGRNGIG